MNSKNLKNINLNLQDRKVELTIGNKKYEFEKKILSVIPEIYTWPNLDVCIFKIDTHFYIFNLNGNLLEKVDCQGVALGVELSEEKLVLISELGVFIYDPINFSFLYRIDGLPDIVSEVKLLGDELTIKTIDQKEYKNLIN